MNEVADVQKEEAIQSIYNDKIVGNFTKNELDTLRNTIAKGTNNDEFRLFVQTCVNMKLNPFLNHIHCMVYDGKNGRQISIQISSEGVLSIARRSEGYKGVDAQVVHENDEFEIDLATKKIIKHTIGFPRGRVVGGYAIARKDGFEDKIMLMDVAEVEHMKKGRNSNMWNTWFIDMFKKHMLKRVAKEQFGIDLTEEEVQSSPMDTVDSFQDKPSGIQINEFETVHVQEQINTVRDEIEMNVPDEIVAQVMENHFFGKQEDELNIQEWAALKKFCQLEMKKLNTVVVENPHAIERKEIIQQPVLDEINEFSTFFS